jgi:hypothetical protein
MALVGSKLSPTSDALPAPRELVLVADDLPRGWVSKGGREWRTGLQSDEDWAVRAREAGGRSYAEGFQRGDDAWQTVNSQATPLCSVEDAASALAVVPERMLRNPDPSVMHVGTHEMSLPEPVGDDARCLRLAVQNVRRPEWRGVNCVVSWRRGTVLAVVLAAGPEDTLDLGWVLDLARTQDARIKAMLAARAAESAAGPPEPPYPPR